MSVPGGSGSLWSGEKHATVRIRGSGRRHKRRSNTCTILERRNSGHGIGILLCDIFFSIFH